MTTLTQFEHNIRRYIYVDVITSLFAIIMMSIIKWMDTRWEVEWINSGEEKKK